MRCTMSVAARQEQIHSLTPLVLNVRFLPQFTSLRHV